MELATNTFSGGLLLDTNPMVLGTDTMTDCLNGTLVTMNGNEVILLNDMGNRRVNNAFLPPGYEPVGMKEYGGIIYVAAYNPITNKSLIGSFPSPQRKVDDILELSGEFNFSQFFDKNNTETDSYLGIDVLKSDSFMIPLTGKNSLRAGDKFSIYSPELYTYSEIDSNKRILKAKDLITNFNNTFRGKVKSPKNKKYTLSIGILNSLNEFVDITKTLGRWRNGHLISYDSSVSDLYKFNDGYFISKEFNRENLVEADSQLIKTRQKLAVNTYAYKLIGPMYMKALLNHILSFDYNIYGIYKETLGEVSLYIEGYITYNCPDSKITNGSLVNDENYYTYEETTPNFNVFDLWHNGYKITPVPKSTVYEKSKYDLTTNLYTTKVLKKYIININDETLDIKDNIFNFTIGVNASSTNDNIYLKGLSVRDYIDLSLLGSGEVKVKGWKFYNDVEEESTLLTFMLDAYPEYGKSFKDLEILFTNLQDDSNVVTYTSENIFNGRQTVLLQWNDDDNNHLHYNNVYRVDIHYNTSDNLENSLKVNDITESERGMKTTIITVDEEKSVSYEKVNGENSSKRWVLTSELFNSFYNSNILDFCITTDANFIDKLNISLDSNLSMNVIKNMEFESYTESGNLFSTSESGSIDYSLTNNYVFEYKKNDNSYVVLPTYIPANIISDNFLELNNVSLNNLNSEKRNITYNNGTIEDVVEVVQEDNNNKITLKVSDRFIGTSNLEVSVVENIFGNIKDIKDLVSPSNPLSDSSSGEEETTQEGEFCGVAANYDAGPGRNFLDVIYNNWQAQRLSDNPKDDDNPPNGIHLENVKGTGWLKSFPFREYLERIFNIFNNKTNKLFTELIVGWNLCFTAIPKKLSLNPEKWKNDGPTLKAVLNEENTETYGQTAIITSSNDTRDLKALNEAGIAIAANYPRRWWRATNNLWALFYDDTEFNMPYVYCIYNEKSGESLNLFIADVDNSNYNELFELELEVKADFKLKLDLEIKSVSIGNLDFNFELPSQYKIIQCPKIYSSLDFLDLINNLRIRKVSNIFIINEKVITRDINGKVLNPGKVYFLDNYDKLSISPYTDLFIIDTNRGEINYMLFNGKEIGTPFFQYNTHGSGRDKTVIDFEYVLIVPLELYHILT